MKLPFSFNLKFVFRLLFPGFILSLALLPILEKLGSLVHAGIDAAHLLIVGSILFGWLFVVLDMQLYMLLEGRRYWPSGLRKMFLAFEQKRLAALQHAYWKSKSSDRRQYIETSVELRRFPQDDDGNPIPFYPTRLGNLLAAYEEYPLRAYGMDSIFYWYRIWVVLDDDLREHLDSQQALTDSSVYMTIAFFLAGLLCLVYALLSELALLLPTPPLELNLLLPAGFVCFALSYFIYRSSIHLHAAFGELYKSVFDMHRDKIPVDTVLKEIVALTGDQSINNLTQPEKYRTVWRYLHNNRIKLDGKIRKVAEFRQ